MTPEQHAAQILIEAVRQVESVKLVLLTMLSCFAIAALFALGWRWANRVERMNHFKAREAEARELVEHSIDTIHRQQHMVRRQRNLLADVSAYFEKNRPTFDDKEREPLASSIKVLLAEQQAPLQITFERYEPDSEAA